METATKRNHEKSENSSKKKSRKKQKQGQELAEERRLTALLFGDGVDKNDIAFANKTEEYSNIANEQQAESLFQIDRVGDETGSDVEPEAGITSTNNSSSVQRKSSEPSKKEDTTSEDRGVWHDGDDDVEVDLTATSRLAKLRKSRKESAVLNRQSELEHRLRERYESTAQMGARTDWARLDDVEENDEESEVEKSTAEPLLRGGANQLARNILNTVRCPDANQSDPCKAAVQAVSFHSGSDPDRPLLLTAGFDKTLRFFQVGADKSEKIHGIHFPKLPIYSASFLGTTGNVVVSGRRSFFYIYNAEAGKLDHVPRIIGREEKSLERCVASPDGRTLAFVGNDGYIILFDAANKHWIADLKMNGSVRAITFTPDGEQIIGSGSDGDVYRWDLKSRRCIERFSNVDGTITASLAASSRHLAVGAESGVVNLYSDRVSGINTQANQGLKGQRNPIKSIMNLHTSADLVRFNGDGQILAMSTRREKMGLKLLHVPSATVFSNWPTSKTPLNYVWSMDFSPQSRFLAIGNDQGRCLLYRLTHYQD